jgi:hypothetical protein
VGEFNFIENMSFFWALLEGFCEVPRFPVLHGNVGYACFIHPDSAKSWHR